MLAKALLVLTELLLGFLFAIATIFAAALGYSFVACSTDFAGWAVALVLVWPIQFPLIGVVLFALMLSVAFAVRPLHPVNRIFPLLKRAAALLLGLFVVVAAVSAMTAQQARCNFGF